MVYYVKVRPYVAERLGVDKERYRYADGNVLLWDKELGKVDSGWVFHKEETVARIGGLMMDPYRNRDEQAKSAEDCTPLPLPTDPEWMEPEVMEEIVEAVEEEMELEVVEHAIEDAEEGGEG